MRSVCFIILGIVISLSEPGCQNPASDQSADSPSSEVVDTAMAAKIQFETLRKEFGDIFHGEKVTLHYVFSNEGLSDLVIKHARASCGCTKPVFAENPIPPGQKDSIEVTYNSVGKQGRQRARIFVQSNDPTQPEVVLGLFGMVKVKPRTE